VAENSHGFRAGNRFGLGLSGDLNVVGSLWASVGADVANEQPERWGGVVQQDGNLGRTDVLVGGGLHWSLGAAQLGLMLRIPATATSSATMASLSTRGCSTSTWAPPSESEPQR
jgi:hypothetical protein